MRNGLAHGNHRTNDDQYSPPMPPKGVRRMWEGGPLRQFSDTQVSSHYVGYSGPILKGYAGSYVCDRCQRPCAGVYPSHPSETQREWLCGGCRKLGGKP